MATAALVRRRARSSCSTPPLCNCAICRPGSGLKETGVVFSTPMMSVISHLDLVFLSPETAAAQVISCPARVQGGHTRQSQMPLPHRIVNELSVKSWDPIDPIRGDGPASDQRLDRAGAQRSAPPSPKCVWRSCCWRIESGPAVGFGLNERRRPPIHRVRSVPSSDFPLSERTRRNRKQQP
jgi:hypothetical protein